MKEDRREFMKDSMIKEIEGFGSGDDDRLEDEFKNFFGESSAGSLLYDAGYPGIVEEEVDEEKEQDEDIQVMTKVSDKDLAEEISGS